MGAMTAHTTCCMLFRSVTRMWGSISATVVRTAGARLVGATAAVRTIQSMLPGSPAQWALK